MIETWSRGLADDNMPEEMIVSVLERVRRHPWWRARAKLALDVLRAFGYTPPAFVADVGCGWGTNLDALEAAGYRAVGIDISRRILERIDRANRRLIEADLNQPPPADAEPAEALLLLDVIEHVDDDRHVIRQLQPLVRVGGLAIISVPALPELFSEFDRIQGHRRRYLPETLRAAFSDTGFAVQTIFWWGAWMVPVLRRMRLRAVARPAAPPRSYADYLRLPPWPGTQLMALAYAWERRRALKEQLRTGTSLFAVAIRE
jgi:SAM-dependent methyltransferase